MLPHFLSLFILFLNFLSVNFISQLLGTKRPQCSHCNGTETPPPPWHLAGTKLLPIWHLPGTCLAPSRHLAGTKKNLLLYGTFLAPILFRHMNHQSQACSCNWRYFLTGSWFWICTTVEKMLKTALRPPCKTPESVHWQPWGLEYNPAAVGRCGGATTCF